MTAPPEKETEKDKHQAIKAQVRDIVPKRIAGLQFEVQSKLKLESQSVVDISSEKLYEATAISDRERLQWPNGPLDLKLGISSKVATCPTCHLKLANCVGHWGLVRLALPAFHIGYLRFTMKVLQEICKDCSRLLLTSSEKQSFRRELRAPGLDNLRRLAILKRINTACRKAKQCMYCGATNGQIRKVGPLKLVHDQFVSYNKSTAAKKVVPHSKLVFDASFTKAKEVNPDVARNHHRAMQDLNPLTVLNLFKRIPDDDVMLLGLNPAQGRPEMLLWQYVPAPPVCIRPSVQQQDGSSNEDDITMCLSEVVKNSAFIRAALENGMSLHFIEEEWETMQLRLGAYVNAEVPGIQLPVHRKITRGFCQRLKGKQGRFRGNLSGKRVDFSGRTVISPDPNLSIEQVAIPQRVAKVLTYPERVTYINQEKLRDLVRNGPNKWPGALTVTKSGSDEHKINLRFGKREPVAKALRIGDIVDRHLEDNDIVLFNRQPSLHKLSIMAHRARVLPWRTFRLNECVCTPYNADFDGDEMNVHLPQTEEARAEAINLMGVKYNLSTPKNGEPIIAATQDFITASYLLSQRDRFYDLQTFTFIVQHMMQDSTHIDLPQPAILKPKLLWTGKQVFSLLLRPNKKSNVRLNLDAKCKAFKSDTADPYMCPNDGYLVIRDSEVLSGEMDKSTVGGGKKSSVFYILMRDYGPGEAVVAMNRLSRLCARLLGTRGFSIGVRDVYPSDSLTRQKAILVEDAYVRCDEFIREYKNGTLKKSPGCNMEITLENKMSGELSLVRQKAGDFCVKDLSHHSAPIVMAKCGSKGSNINVAQMVAVVGQQIIGGARVADGFSDRTLPHFHKNARDPPSKGFVRNSFYTGLVATEFLFHAISGREGLVDTAVKTAETGYMSRRLMKALEDLAVKYDDTVRTSDEGIVQFQFGADKLDPLDMEGDAKPVHFDRTWIHAEAVTWDNDQRSLRVDEARSLVRKILDEERKRYPRKTLCNKTLRYDDERDENVDGDEGPRIFLNDVESFIEKHVISKQEKKRKDLARKGCDETFIDGYVDRVAKISKTTVEVFIKSCLQRYTRAHVEPGHPVGAVGAQSIGEPGTQMTLKTFHFAGVAGMNLTQGVPRIKEIINASASISTPIITCPLNNDRSREAARDVKGRIEKTYVRDIIGFVETVWDSSGGKIRLRIDRRALSALHLGLSADDIKLAITDKKQKPRIPAGDVSVSNQYIDVLVRPANADVRKPQSARSKADELSDLLLRGNMLKNILPNIPISGYANATRAIIQEDASNGTFKVLVEGYGLRECMNTFGVVGEQCWTNNVMETHTVLGCEASRTTIAREIGSVMGDMNIDPRHMELLADVMTFKGAVLGITRFGMSKMRDSVLQLASFERTADHLFDAATGMKMDGIHGVSECIIMGQSMRLGTGAFGMIRRLGIPRHKLDPQKTLFRRLWNRIDAAASTRPRRHARLDACLGSKINYARSQAVDA